MSTPDRAQKLKQVLAQCLQRLQEGKKLVDSAVIDQFPDLMPELSAELKKIRLVHNARLMAGQTGQPAQPLPQRPPAPPAASVPGLQPTIDHVPGVPSGAVPNNPNPSPNPPISQSPPQRMPLDRPAMPIAPPAGEAPRVRYFGDYELLEELGRGGMGVVYKARQVSLNRLVAIKMLLAGTMASEEEVKRFYAEAEAAGRLEHPHIVPIYEVGEHQGTHYFSMAYVRGLSLHALLREGPLPAKKAAEYLAKVADAIAYAHDQGVLHRDIKPHNILIDENDQPRVTDFGLAKRVGDVSEMTATGQVLGTPSYMPPEQALAEREHIGPHSDVYSLGATLYACITGRPPFQAESPTATVLQLLSSDAIPPTDLNPAVPRDLNTIALKCLEREPANRYDSAASLRDELTRFLEDHPILARPIGSFERGWRWARRNPVLAGLLAAVLLSLTAGVAGSTYFAIQAEGRAVDADKQRRRADEKTMDETRARKTAENAMAKALDAAASERQAKEELKRKVAYLNYRTAMRDVTNGDLSEGLIRLTHGLKDAREADAESLARLIRSELSARKDEIHELVAVLEHPRSVLCLSFNSNGTRLASGCEDGSVRLWDTATWKMVDEIFAPQRRSVTATRFSPSNDLILFGTGFGAQREGTVYVWDFAANAVRAELTHDDWIRDIVFTPRGDKFLSASCGDLTNRPGRLRLFDANQFVPLEMKFDDDGHLRRLSVSPDGEVVAGASKGKDLTSERGMTWLLKNGQLAGPPLEDPASHREFGVYGVAFSADGSLIFTGNGAGRVVSYGNRTGRITGLPIEHIKGVREVKVSRDNQRILTVCESQTAHVWDAATRTPVGQVLRHLGPTTTADISSDGGYYAVGGVARDGAGEVRIWRSARRSLLAPPIAHPGSVSNFVIAADAKTVVTGGHLRVGIWDLATGKAHGNSLAMQEGVSFVALHPDGSQVLAAAGDPAKGGSQRWDMVSRSPLESFRRHPRFIYSCGYSPDGTTAFTASVDGVKFWTLPDWQEASPRVHDSLVTAVRFHPDGKSFLTAGMDKTVRHWDFASKKELFRWKFSSVVRTLAFTPDGRRFVTGNDDGILQFWRANHALADSIELRHPAEVVFVDFHPREPLLLTVCNDGKLRFWNFELQESVGPVLPNTTLARFLPDGTATMRAARNGELTLFQHPESNSITAFTICEAMEAALGVTLGPSALSVLTAEEWRSRRNELTIPDRHR